MPRSVAFLWRIERTMVAHAFATQGLLLIGAIFKQTQPDESDEERRELERYAIFVLRSCFTVNGLTLCNRMVAEAASGKSKHHQLRAAQRAKKHEHAHAHTHANGSGEKVNGESAPAEKAAPAPAA